MAESMRKPLILLFLLCLCFSFSLAQRGRPISHPELPDDPPARPPAVPASVAGGAVPLVGTPNGGKQQPFLEEDDDEDLSELLDKIKDLADAITDLFDLSSPTTTSSRAGITVAPTLDQSHAAAGCAIYSTYNSICSPQNPAGVTTCLFENVCETVDAAEAYSSAFAGCACYSSTYFVPNIYDNAAWACAQLTTGSVAPTITASAGGALQTDANGEIEGFCYFNNVRLLSSVYGAGVSMSASSSSSSSSPTLMSTTTSAQPTGTAGGGGNQGAGMGMLQRADGAIGLILVQLFAVSTLGILLLW